MDASGAFTVHRCGPAALRASTLYSGKRGGCNRPDHWAFEHTNLQAGAEFGSAHTGARQSRASLSLNSHLHRTCSKIHTIIAVIEHVQVNILVCSARPHALTARALPVVGYEVDGCEHVLDADGLPVPTHRDGTPRARSCCRFVLPLVQFIPYSLTYSVPLFLQH
jgi:hypothetical protein